MIDVIVNPDDNFEDVDWLFSPSPNIINEIDEEIKYYRRLDRQSHGELNEVTQRQQIIGQKRNLIKNIRLYKLNIVYNQIEEARGNNSSC